MEIRPQHIVFGTLGVMASFFIPGVLILAIAFALATQADGWDGLVYIAVGALLAVLAGTIALLFTARRVFAKKLQRPRWGLYVLIIIVSATVAAVAGLALSDLSYGVGVLFGIAAAPTLAVIGSLALSGLLKAKWLIIFVAALVAVPAAGVGAVYLIHSSQRIDTLRPYDDHLPLINGDSLNVEFNNLGYYQTQYPDRYLSMGEEPDVFLEWENEITADPQEYSQLWLHVSTQASDCDAGPKCSITEIGDGPHGTIYAYESGVENPGYGDPADYLFVKVDDVEWRISGDKVDQQQMISVLNSLQPVDARTFDRVSEKFSCQKWCD